LIFSLASAISYRFAGVAPVRGGTYFSLQRQRKVGKRMYGQPEFCNVDLWTRIKEPARMYPGSKQARRGALAHDE
jgi:hypothetical protein